MIFKRILFGMMAASAFSAAVAVAVFALGFALYAGLEPHLGRAGAAAGVAVACVLLISASGLAMARVGRPKRAVARPPVPEGVLDRALAFMKQKPVLATAAAIAAGVLAVRNPKYLGSVLKAFVEGKSPTT